MAHSQINPLLIQMLTGKDSGESPTRSALPGAYVREIFRNKEQLSPIYEKNHHMLTCKSCSRKGKYDVGILSVNSEEVVKDGDTQKHIQMTGYFRCKHCNEAGNWELPNSILISIMVGSLPLLGGSESNPNVSFGKNQLFDGTSHQYATDAEEHLLQILKERPRDAYIWNRLGNLYQKGNRPELGVSVFEHSVRLDPKQVESHYTLGDMLAQIEDFPNASYHFRQMLLHAREYKKLPAEKLRDMLAIGLRELFIMSDHTDGEVSILPTPEELEASVQQEIQPGTSVDLEMEIFPDDVETFFPLAEIFMGLRAKEIPLRERTLNVPKASKAPVKKKKKKRKRRK